MFFFASGYFCGQFVAFADLAEQVEKDSFSDKIGYAVNTLFKEKDEKDEWHEIFDIYEENASGEFLTSFGAPSGSL